MQNLQPGLPSLPKLGGIKRRVVNTRPTDMVQIGPLDEARKLPLLAQPNLPGVDLHDWLESHREEVLKVLHENGGILFRGFECPLAGFSAALSPNRLDYNERSSPRKSVGDKIYTSTEHPASEPIFFHNENSYQKYFPKHIAFACETPAASGGQTPIADTRRVLERISAAVREKFRTKNVMYVRNFAPGLGLRWQDVFNSEDQAEVEKYCQAADIECEWYGADKLRTRHVRPSELKHPETGDWSWFNHAAFFHVTTLPERTQKMLLTLVPEGELPTNTYYGDGEPIEADVVEHIREAYKQETVRFDWRRGDILLLDNLIVAHARDPFDGARRILVSMMDAIGRDAAV